MPRLDSTVSLINQYLASGKLNRRSFQSSQMYGLIKLATVFPSSGPSVTQPVGFTKQGNETDAFIDDKYPFQSYHRVLGLDYSFTNVQQFGNGLSHIKETARMTMVCFADPKRIDLTQEDLVFLVCSGFPTTFSKSQLGSTKISKVDISPGSANIDSQKVLQGEYQGSYPKLPPQSIYFSLNYTIEMTVGRDCLDCQDC